MTSRSPAVVADDKAEAWARAERRWQLVRLKGFSLREAARDEGVTHATIWKDVRAYERFLALADTRTVAEKRAAFEALCFRIIAKAEQVFTEAGSKSLNRTGALNTINTTLGHLRAVQGLDAPKATEKSEGPSRITVGWEP